MVSRANDAARAKGHFHPKALGYHLLEDLQLDIAHKLACGSPQPLIPHDVELGVFLLQLARSFPQGGVGIPALRGEAPDR